MIDARQPQHTCILTLQAARPGGVPTVVDWWYRFLTRWGHRATVLYAAFDETQINFVQRLARTIRFWRLHNRPEHPNPTVAHASPPVPLWLMYFVPQWIFGSVLPHFDQIVFAGGPVHAALPAALRKLPFIIWMGTLYEDELMGKIAVGDQWAKGVIASPFWKFLVWQESLVLKRASRILVQSPYTLRRIKERFPELASNLDLVMVPVDTKRFTPLPDHRRQQEQPYLLNVSRINDPRKNIPLLLEAFKQISTVYPDLKLVLAGDEPSQFILNLRDSLGLGDRIIFKGKVASEELLELYRHAELLVISSAQEGLGIVMLEALSCGVPVIATDCGGPEGIVVDGVTGRLVPNYDANLLAAAALDALRNPADLAAMRERCRTFACEHWSERVVEQRLLRHFTAAYPSSTAALQVDLADTPAELQTYESAGRPAWWREWFAVAWSAIVVMMYLQHQAALHWPAIQNRILAPLLDKFT